MGKKILIIEDEKNISDIIIINAKSNGYECDAAYDGEDGYNKARENNYDLILLDLMLPKLDGCKVCEKLRSENINTPIIMVTAKEEEADKILGLELGADDYITKPFSIKELFARIKANIRRSAGEPLSPSETNDDEVYMLDCLTINNLKYEVRKNGVLMELTKKEYDLLLFFAKNTDKIFTREELLEHVWGYKTYYGDVRTVDVTIRRLRTKIEDVPSEPKIIMNKRTVGYYVNKT